MNQVEVGLKDVQIGDSILGDRPLRAAIERATESLQAEVGPPVNRASARWFLIRDERYNPFVILELSEEDGSAQTLFSREGLINADDFRLGSLMLHSWGNLLADTSHRGVEKLKLMIMSPESE